MRLPIWLLGAGALAALTLAGAGSASAQISATFAITTTEDCIVIVSPATFNSEFQPSAGPIFDQTVNSAGTITFNGNGTGSVDNLLGVGAATPVPPGTYTSTDSSGVSYKETYQFNYTVNSGIITTTLVSGSYTRTFLQGFRTGETATFDVLNDVAYISANGNELLLLHDGAYVKTESYSNGDVLPQVCSSATRGYKYP